MLESLRIHHHPHDPNEPLPPGTPLVALKNAEAFFTNGLLEKKGLIFGLLEADGGFMYRLPPDGDGSLAVQHRTLAEMADKGYAFFVPTADCFAADAATTLRRARNAAGTCPHGEISPIGDDFVYECQTGKPVTAYIEAHPNIGKLVSIPFSVKALLSRSKFISQHLEAQVQPEKAQKVQSIMDALQGIADLHDLALYNRAVCMGDNLVANFSTTDADTPATDADACELRLHTLQNFAGDSGIPALRYASSAWFGDTRKRMQARNAALRLLMERPKFSLNRYNSEHFCYFCTQGKLKSPQKRALMLKPAMMFLPGLSWLNPFKKIRKIYKTIFYIFILRDLVCSFREKP